MAEIQNNLLQAEKERIKDVLDIMLPIEYGFISKKDGSKITDRDWIHNVTPEELETYYEVNTDPEVTIKNQLGICQDQAIAIKYLMHKYHPEDPVCLFALTKPPKGHCVACYEHDGEWYYLETSWDKERGLHGPFDSKDDIKNYLKQMYFKHHKNDTPATSETKVTTYHEPVTEDLKDDAKAYFGTTYNPNTCFYINTDGTLLDGSGLKLGSNSSRRTVDHREISDIMPDGTEGTEAMLEYMREGNIRYMPEINGFDLIKEPTDRQYCVIKSLFSRYTWRKDTYVDFSAENGDVLDTITIPAGRSVVEAIKQHFSRVLTEDTRNQLIAKSRNAGQYKVNVRGKNRFERKKFSRLAAQVQKYNQIDMNAFFKQDQLLVTIPVQGETAEYNVVIKLDGVLAEIARNIKANNGKFEYRTVMQAVTKIFNTTNVYVKCSCDDFKYRFDHWSIINKWGANDTAHDPGPGKGIANPANDKGNGCKHILLALANGAWIMKICSVIINYINYMDKNRHDAFIAAIFPKLYGVPADAAEEAGIVPPDTDLKSDKNLVDTINQWAANRGKFVKGSNKNPVTGTGGKAQSTNNERTIV